MKSISLDDEWRIEYKSEYSLKCFLYHCNDIISVFTQPQRPQCRICKKRVPPEVIGFLNLCRWKV